MAWWDGKDKIVALCFGDSNLGSLATPTNSESGLQPYNTANRFWARDGSLPYVQSGHTWRALDPDGTSRLDESVSANGDDSVQGTLYCGQILGGHGCPVMAMSNTVQSATGLPVYAYSGFMGGSVSDDWNNYLWTQLEATATDALAAIDVTSVDIIYFSVGGGDLLVGTDWWRGFLALTGQTDWHQPFTSPTAAEYSSNMHTLRSNLIAAGWWVPGVTQVVINDIPRNGYAPLAAYPEWQGIELILRNFNDRVDLSGSFGNTLDPLFPIHYSPASYVKMGNYAGDIIVSQIENQNAVIGINGSVLTMNNMRLRVNEVT